MRSTLAGAPLFPARPQPSADDDRRRDEQAIVPQEMTENTPSATSTDTW
ncbi:hypothetical protein [Mycobacterium sp. ITM-2016-00318]|nr:hypothetical protein [Mycobacterium sp. ITM-2016-00318]WNG90763.1 hypothetical protein C6A82_014510 [Mycobacterium sp. ITM-2016-00318]